MRDSAEDAWRPAEGWPLPNQSSVSLTNHGIVFGNPRPRLPSIAVLQDLGIQPSDVVKQFSLAIADETFDDLTVYRVTDDEFAVALEVDGVVTSIYYSGQFLEILLEAQGQSIPHCELLQVACCIKEQVGDETDPENPPVQVPKPHLRACSLAIEICPTATISAACTCLGEACQWCFTENHPAYPHCSGNPNNA